MPAELTAERARQLFRYDPETGALYWQHTRGRQPAGTRAGCVSRRRGQPKGYRLIRIDMVLYRAHRVVWLMHTGSWPASAIDHVNGDYDDNRLANLRLATPSENAWNQGKNRRNSSGLKGVVFHRRAKKWMARIVVKRRGIYLGIFDTPEAAHAAYCAAAREHHGNFANFGREA